MYSRAVGVGEETTMDVQILTDIYRGGQENRRVKLFFFFKVYNKFEMLLTKKFGL